MVISREIRPLACSVIHPPPIQRKCFIGLRSQASLSISALSGRREWYAHVYGICAPFFCISLKNIWGGGRGELAAIGLKWRDIAVKMKFQQDNEYELKH
jgi:hypothetical protein